LPPKVLDSAMYAKAIPAVKEAVVKNLSGAAAAQLVSKAADVKMAPHKIDALVKAAPTLNDKELRNGLQNAVAENNYDGVILSLVQKYCPSGLLGLALTGLLASFMSGMTFTRPTSPGTKATTTTCGWAASSPSWASS